MCGVICLKVIFFKSGNSKVSFEKILFSLFILSFLLLVTAQITLSSPNLRSLVAVDSRYEGTPLKTEEFLYNQGEVIIELVKPKTDSSIKILLNGEVVSDFYDLQVTLDVLDGDVIEIDASNVKNEVEVRIADVSNNINRKYIGKSVSVKASIKILSQILF
jgi:hypothetical protein